MSEEKVKVISKEIIVGGTPEKPYYEIKYLKAGESEYTIGYGSHDLDFVFNWYNNVFETVPGELTPAERIEQLEKEKAELESVIKNQEKYESFKKSSDDIALVMKAFVDSGFSRSEAMQLMSMAMMQNMVPSFLRR